MVQMSRHSLVTAARPRRENWRNRRFILRFPKTGSMVVLRRA